MRLNKKYLLAFFLGIVVIGVLGSSGVSFGADIGFRPYWGPLVACQDDAGQICDSVCDFLDLTQNLIYFGLTILLLVIAPLMLIGGGVMIMISGGSEERLSKGKKMITGTVIGVVIALLAFVIVATFLWLIGNGSNETKISWPDVECSVPDFEYLPQPEVVLPNGPDEPGGPDEPEGQSSHSLNLAELQARGIQVTSTVGPSGVKEDCEGQVSGCTTLKDLPSEAIDGLIETKLSCPGCQIVVTGGTEPGHQTHGPGKAIVDVDDTPSFNNYTYSNIGNPDPVPCWWYLGADDYWYRFEDQTCGYSPHWHICYNHAHCPNATDN